MDDRRLPDKRGAGPRGVPPRGASSRVANPLLPAQPVPPQVKVSMTQHFERRRAAYDALAFMAEAGVDVALDDAPRNRFSEVASAAVASAHPQAPAEPRLAAQPIAAAGLLPGLTPPPVRTRPGAPPSPDRATGEARELAASAATLDELQALLAAFDGCALKATAKGLAFAAGAPGARVMLVGEAPGQEEDRHGVPFVGRSGQLLDRILAAIGLDRRHVYISNVVYWRPPGNRTPTPQEAAICKPFIRRQIELCDPDILVCLGKSPAAGLLDVKDGLLKTRGRWFDYDTGTRTIRALVTMHPAYLLRQPLQKRLAWRDFKALRQALAETPPRG